GVSPVNGQRRRLAFQPHTRQPGNTFLKRVCQAMGQGSRTAYARSWRGSQLCTMRACSVQLQGQKQASDLIQRAPAQGGNRDASGLQREQRAPSVDGNSG